MKTIKRFVTLFLVSVLLVSGFPMQAAAQDFNGMAYNGSGSVNDPYLIRTTQELKAFATEVNGGATYAGIYFALAKDIDFTGSTDPWTAIGVASTKPFSGVFDGKGYAISGLYYSNTNTSNYGLFGYVKNAVIRNLGVADCNFTARNNLGGIVGLSQGTTIENCYATGKLTSNLGISETGRVGGIVGRMESSSKVNACHFSGMINSTSSSGGIVGMLISGDVTNCHTAGHFTGGSMGGIEGWSNFRDVATTNVKQCYTTAHVMTTASTSNGISGGGYSTLENCVALSTYLESNLGFRIGFTSHILKNNYAYKGMLLYLTPVTSTGVNSQHGKDVEKEQIASVSFWRDTVHFDPAIWIMEAGKLPVLRNTGGPQSNRISSKIMGTLSGAGTKANPFELWDANDVDFMKNNLQRGKYYKIMADIDYAGTYYVSTATGFDPIPLFIGYLDGNHKTLRGLFITRGAFDDKYGFFAEIGDVHGGVEPAEIKNLNLDVTFAAGSQVGGLAAVVRSNTVVENCAVSGSVSGTADVGGLIGSGEGAIRGCTNYAKVKNTTNRIGGIAGIQRGLIEDCVNFGTITGGTSTTVDSTPGHMGGIVGSGNSVVRCFNYADVTGYYYIGGIVGSGDLCTESKNTGKVTYYNQAVGGIGGMLGETTKCINNGVIVPGNSSAMVTIIGGIVGRVGGTIRDCYNTGPVTGWGSIGGVAGSLESGTIETSYSTGIVTSTSTGSGGLAAAGGLLGSQVTYNQNMLKNCVSLGPSVSSTGAVNRVVSVKAHDFLKNNYAISTMMVNGVPMTSSDADSAMGKDISEAQKNSASFWKNTVGFSDSVWAIRNGAPPALAWEISVTDVVLNITALTLFTGNSQALSATILPTDAGDKGVSWSSDNTGVATVTASGVVKAVTPGTARIKVTSHDGGFTDTCTVTVKQTIPVSGVSLTSLSEITLMTGKSTKLSCTISPSSATNKAVVWTSDKPSVATVDQNGTVNAKGDGKAVITVKSVDGGKTAKCTVTVSSTVKVNAVSVTGAPGNLTVGKSVTLRAIVSPSNATNRTVTWKSLNTKIATVDKNGAVNAKSPGAAKITATAGGKTKTVTIQIHQYVTLRIGKTKAIQNGKTTTIDSQGTKPMKIAGRTMVPVRFVAEKMGGKVSYKSDTKPIVMTYGSRTVKLQLNSKRMEVKIGGKTTIVTLEVAAQKRNGRTYIPLRAISQALGFTVYYHSSTEIIVVNNPSMSNAIRSERVAEGKKVIK